MGYLKVFETYDLANGKQGENRIINVEHIVEIWQGSEKEITRVYLVGGQKGFDVKQDIEKLREELNTIFYEIRV